MTIELIYDLDCPNVAKARANLAAALAAARREARWTEWDPSAGDSPPYVRQYGSPTVLVGGQDVSGAPTGDGGSCCRLYRSGLNRFEGAPSVGQSSFGRSPPGGASIGSGVRRSSSTKPYSSVSASPTVSPYLNLFREGLGESDDFSYQTLVWPQLQQQQLNQQFQQQNLELSRRVQSISAQGAYKNSAGAETQAPTGHQTAFGYHSHYFPSAAPRRQR